MKLTIRRLQSLVSGFRIFSRKPINTHLIGNSENGEVQLIWARTFEYLCTVCRAPGCNIETDEKD